MIERKQKEWLKTKEKEEVEMKENKVESGEATTKIAEVLETPTIKPEKLTTVGQKSVQVWILKNHKCFVFILGSR